MENKGNGKFELTRDDMIRIIEGLECSITLKENFIDEAYGKNVTKGTAAFVEFLKDEVAEMYDLIDVLKVPVLEERRAALNYK